MKYKFNSIASLVIMLGASFLYNTGLAQPVVTVPSTCNVVVTGAGVGVVAGFGGTVGSGGIVVMPDPFAFASPAGDFVITTNGTTITGWHLIGDLSAYPNPTPGSPIQPVGAPLTATIQSYNENPRPSEVAPPSTGTLGRSKGRISIGYASAGCGGAGISFDVYKTYPNTGSGTGYVPDIIGPDCWLPGTTYTYSVDQIASDNLPDAIGLDNYYWTITDATSGPAAITSSYFSADHSSFTFVSPAAGPSFLPPFTVQVCYGRANPWDANISTPTTCVTHAVSSAPTSPTFTPGIPTCLSTGVHSFTATYTPVPGSSYVWSSTNASWTIAPGPGSLTVTTMDDNPGVLSLTVTGACLPATFTYTVTRSYNPAVTTISGPTCVDDGSTNAYSIISPDPVSNNVTCWTPPAVVPAWTVTPTNGSATNVNVTLPPGTPAGTYTLSATTCACPGGVVSLVINVKPAVPTGLAGPTCVDRNGSAGYGYSCSLVPGATSYTWSIPSGWTCTAGCTTNSPTFVPGGTAAGPVVISVKANGTGGCNGNPSATYAVNYNSITPAMITAGCFNFGFNATTNITVGNAPSPFYGTYSVTATPAGLFTSYTVTPTGGIVLGTLAGASGTYTVSISHVASPCGSSSATSIVVNVVSNGAMITTFFNPAPTGSDTYIEFGGPGSPTYQWYINSAAVSGATNSVLVLSSATPPPGPVCVRVASGGCATQVCASSTGTHGLKEAHQNDIHKTQQQEVQIYPNPNSGDFKVLVPEFQTLATMKIIDASGKSMGEHSLQAGENSINNNNNLPPGIYYVIVNTDGDMTTYKIEILKK